MMYFLLIFVQNNGNNVKSNGGIYVMVKAVDLRGFEQHLLFVRCYKFFRKTKIRGGSGFYFNKHKPVFSACEYVYLGSPNP